MIWRMIWTNRLVLSIPVMTNISLTLAADSTVAMNMFGLFGWLPSGELT